MVDKFPMLTIMVNITIITNPKIINPKDYENA
jgi:hypothetical protein